MGVVSDTYLSTLAFLLPLLEKQRRICWSVLLAWNSHSQGQHQLPDIKPFLLGSIVKTGKNKCRVPVGHNHPDISTVVAPYFYGHVSISRLPLKAGSAVLQIRELVVEYAEAKVMDVKLKRGLADLSLTFLRGSIFGHPSLPVMGRFNRIHVGANCPKARLKDLLRLLKPGESHAIPSFETNSSKHTAAPQRLRRLPDLHYFSGLHSGRNSWESVRDYISCYSQEGEESLHHGLSGNVIISPLIL